MNAFNRQEMVAWERTFHFPHYRLASGSMSVLQAAGLRDPALPARALSVIDWHHNQWDRRRLILKLRSSFAA